LSLPVPEGVELRQLTGSDVENLGRLFWSAFGPVGEGDASVVATTRQTAIAASIVVRDDAHEMLPLLAFLVTSPEHQRRGIGRGVLTDTLRRMDALGIHELHLA
jgi:predicted N-acetyltransferase YhbS